MFIRDFELIVGDQVFTADGGYNGFRIKFNIQKTMVGYPNTAEIAIYNLKNDTFDQLQERGLPVELSVGHKDEKLVRLFKGDLQTNITSREGASRVSVISCLDGGQAITFSKGQKTFDTVPVADIVEYIATEQMGLEIGKVDVDGETGYKGRVVSGAAQRELDDLSREFGFSWSVQDEEFFAIDDDRELPEIWRLSRAEGLNSAKQILSGPLQVKAGVEITALLNPRIFPNHLVFLEWDEGSDFPESLENEYKVHNISFAGDSHGPDWAMNLQCFTLGGF
jgi:hypothetical protein